MSDRETTVASVPSDNAAFDEESGAATTALHRDIEATLPNQECVARALAKVHLWRAGTNLRE
jgi:hypothetical protein